MNRSRGFPFPYTSLFTCQQAVGIANSMGMLTLRLTVSNVEFLLDFIERGSVSLQML
jgi:hypothetical protein